VKERKTERKHTRVEERKTERKHRRVKERKEWRFWILKRIEDEKEKWSEDWMNEYKRMIYCHPNIIFDIRMTGGAKYGGGEGGGGGVHMDQ